MSDIENLERRLDAMARNISDAKIELTMLKRRYEVRWVQVVYLSKPGIPNDYDKRYAYIDPSGKLKKGDYVIAGYMSAPAEVVALGKGNADARSKPILAKLVREHL